MNEWHYANPVRLIFEDAADRSVARVLEEHGSSSVLLISRDWVPETEFFRALESRIGKMKDYPRDRVRGHLGGDDLGQGQ